MLKTSFLKVVVRSWALGLCLLAAVLPVNAGSPTITAPPVSQTVSAGQSVFFSVTATDLAPLTYQWRREGTNLIGATGAVLSLGVARTDQAGNYSVVVSSTDGSVANPPPATLTVSPAPSGYVTAWGSSYYGQATVPSGLSGVTAIGAGGYHTVALKSDGTVVAWGNNFFGQTNVPAGLSGVTAIVAGVGHTVALKQDGKVVAWGKSYSGQTNVPAGLSGVTAIAAGGGHTVALKQDGTVVAWGENDSGQTDVPVGLSGVTAIAAGGAHTVALKQDGTVVAWGYNDYGQTTLPAGLSGVTAIAAGTYHTMAVKQDGTVVAYGDNTFGQAPVPAGLSGVTAIAAGGKHTAAVKQDGTVVAYGDNTFGQVTVPAGLSGVTVLAAGYLHTVVAWLPRAPVFISQPQNQTGNAGEIARFSVVASGFPPPTYQWLKGGTPISGETRSELNLNPVLVSHAGSYTVVASNSAGSATSAPPAVLTVNVAAPSILTQPGNQTVATGQSASFRVVATSFPPPTYQWFKDGVLISGATGRTLSLGLAQTNHVGSYSVVVSNEYGSVTSAPPAFLTVTAATPRAVAAWGDNTFGQTNVPAGLSGVTAIAAGGKHTVGMMPDGTVVAWGDNGYGKSTVPAGLSGVTAIAAGGDHTLALKQDGTVVAWGDNGYGQANVPAGLSAVTAIAAGGEHTVALKPDGTVAAWGQNYFEQTTVPAGLSEVTAIAAGTYHTVALKQDGTVIAWGRNLYGETNVPPSLSGVTAIAAGFSYTVALKQDGTVIAWGYNDYGQTTVPAGLSGVTAIAAGYSHALALKQDGTVIAWGRNDSGQTTVPAGLSGVTAITAGDSHSVAALPPQVPVFISQPQSQTANAGGSASFSVVASGIPLPTYQWLKRGVPISGETGSELNLNPVLVSHAGSYTVVASNSAGSVTSSPPAVLAVNVAAPSILTQPGNQTVALGRSASFSVVATGFPPPTYQWFKDGVLVNGATGSTLSLGLAGTNQGGSYSVVVSNTYGSVTSAPPATLTVSSATPGYIRAWGDNSYGQTAMPSGLSGVVTIAAGYDQTLVLKSDGTVKAWGYNRDGQTNVPAGLSGVMAIAAGAMHTVALRNSGTVVT